MRSAPPAAAPTSPAPRRPRPRWSTPSASRAPCSVTGISALGALTFIGGAERCQRIEHPRHRARAQRGIAGEHGGDRRGRHRAHHQPRAGAGIAEIERRRRARPAADARPLTRQSPGAVAGQRRRRSARIASAVLSTSSASSRPEMRVSPTASAPRIRARWEIDLSPGTAAVPLQGAGPAGASEAGGSGPWHCASGLQKTFDRRRPDVANDPLQTTLLHGKHHLGQGRSRNETRVPQLRGALLRPAEAPDRMPEMRLQLRAGGAVQAAPPAPARTRRCRPGRAAGDRGRGRRGRGRGRRGRGRGGRGSRGRRRGAAGRSPPPARTKTKKSRKKKPRPKRACRWSRRRGSAIEDIEVEDDEDEEDDDLLGEVEDEEDDVTRHHRRGHRQGRTLVLRSYGTGYQTGPRLDGAIAQLGERLHGMQEVSGSIPLGSTNSRPTGGTHFSPPHAGIGGAKRA